VQDWRWSITRAHLRGKDDGLTSRAAIKDRVLDFTDLLASAPEAELFDKLRCREHWPASRRRSFSLSHPATDRARPRARQAWPEAAWTARPSMGAIAKTSGQLSALSPQLP
jgi:hypothetical protein